MKYCILLVNIFLASIPHDYIFDLPESFNRNNGLNSNMIIDIDALNNSTFLSSSNGLGYSNSYNEGKIGFFLINLNNLFGLF